MVSMELGIDDKHFIKLQYQAAEIGFPLRPGSAEEVIMTPK